MNDASKKMPPAARIPTLGAGWAFPVAGAPLDIAIDSEGVAQAIEIILSTRKGERAMRPDFGCGLDKLLFAPNNGETRAMAEFEVEEALKKWEPRIELVDVVARPDDEHANVLLIDVAYRVRSTDGRFNLVYPFFLDRSLA